MNLSCDINKKGKSNLDATQELCKRLSPYTFPVYLLLKNGVDKNSIEHVGSGFLISHRGMSFFVTAGHIFDRRSEGKLFYFVSDDKVEFLDRDFETTPSKSKTRDDDRKDIAVIIVNPKVGEGVPADGFQHQRIPESMVHRHRAAVPKLLNTIVGFPLTRNKVSEAHGNVLNTEQLSFFAKQSDDAAYKKIGIDRDDFYLARFKEKNVINAATGQNGMTNLKPRGMSGGTLWGTLIIKDGPGSYITAESFLLGVITEHIPEVKSMLCTNIEVAYELAEKLLNRIMISSPSLDDLFKFSINGKSIPFDIKFIQPPRDSEGYFTLPSNIYY